MLVFILTTLVAAIILLVWAWVGYPLLLVLWPKGRENSAGGQSRVGSGLSVISCQDGEESRTESREARISIVIAAYNEEAVIKDRLDNLAAIDLPEQTEILIGCDGCNDRTAAMVVAWVKKREGESGNANVQPAANLRCCAETDDPQSTIHNSRAKTDELRPSMSSVLRRSRSTDNDQQSTINAEKSDSRDTPSPPSFRVFRVFRGCSLYLFDFSERRGKPSVLKDLVAASSGEVLVFSDANTMFDRDAISRLLEPLVDPAIGGTCGRLVLTDGGTTTRESVYWRLETWLKTMESRIDSCLGANGAIYAVRRGTFWEGLPGTTIIDDFVIGMKVREKGNRLVYVPGAMGYEEMPNKVGQEWHRRTRIGAGDYQSIGLCRHCLLPTYGFFSLAFWSHKILRWFTPHLMILVLTSTLISLVLAESQALSAVLWILLAGQVGWYGLALFGWGLGRRPKGGRRKAEDRGHGSKSISPLEPPGPGGPADAPLQPQDNNPSHRAATARDSRPATARNSGSASDKTTHNPSSSATPPVAERCTFPFRVSSVSPPLRRAGSSCLSVIYYFTVMQLALLVGFIKFVRGIKAGTWRRTER